MSRIARILEATDTWGSTVKSEMDKLIDDTVKRTGLSRADAAFEVLQTKDPWYVQTPEGEYLQAVIQGKA